MTQFGWYWLSSRDQRYNNWILYRDVPPVELRLRYRSFCCSSCGKVDEDAALQSGFDSDVVLKSRCDIFHSLDGILCFSEKARETVICNNIQGLEFLHLPQQNKQKHQVALPTLISPVVREMAGFEYNGVSGQPSLNDVKVFCSICHRPREGAYVGPFLQSMQLPEDPLCVVSPSLSPADWRGKKYWLLVSEVVKEIFSREKLVGLEFIRPF